jgi:hypothetical protein
MTANETATSTKIVLATTLHGETASHVGEIVDGSMQVDKRRLKWTSPKKS